MQNNKENKEFEIQEEENKKFINKKLEINYKNTGYKGIITEIKKSKDPFDRLKLFFGNMPVLFWQFKNIKRILGPVATIGALKVLECYDILKDDKLKNTKKSLRAERFIKDVLGMEVSSYNNVHILDGFVEPGKKSLCPAPATFSNLLREFLYDKKAKVKLSDFTGFTNEQIATGLCDLIYGSVIENFWEIEKYCDGDLKRVFTPIAIVAMTAKNANIKLETAKNADVKLDLTSTLNKFLTNEKTNEKTKLKLQENAKFELSDFGDLKDYQIAYGLYSIILDDEIENLQDFYDLIDTDEAKNLKMINKYCSEELKKVFGIGMFRLAVNEKLCPGFSKLVSEKSNVIDELYQRFSVLKLKNSVSNNQRENLVLDNNKIAELRLNIFINVLGKFFKLNDENNKCEMITQDDINRPHETYRALYGLVARGIIKNFNELRKVLGLRDFEEMDKDPKIKLGDSGLIFGRVMVDLLFDYLDLKFKPQTGTFLASLKSDFLINEISLCSFQSFYLRLMVTYAFDCTQPDIQTCSARALNTMLSQVNLNFSKSEYWILRTIFESTGNYCVQNKNENEKQKLRIHIMKSFVFFICYGNNQHIFQGPNTKNFYNYFLDIVTPDALHTSASFNVLESKENVKFKDIWSPDLRKKLFLIFCTMGVWDFKITPIPTTIRKIMNNLESTDLKLDKNELEASFFRIIINGQQNNNSADFPGLYSALTDNKQSNGNFRFLRGLSNFCEEMLEAVICAVVRTMDLKDMEKILANCLGHCDSKEYFKYGIKACIDNMNNVNKFTDRKKIMLILALIKVRYMFVENLAYLCYLDNINSLKGDLGLYNLYCVDNIIEALFDKEKIKDISDEIPKSLVVEIDSELSDVNPGFWADYKLSKDLKVIFDEAFENYIDDETFVPYEFSQLLKYAEIIGLNSKQIGLVIEKIMRKENLAKVLSTCMDDGVILSYRIFECARKAGFDVEQIVKLAMKTKNPIFVNEILSAYLSFCEPADFSKALDKYIASIKKLEVEKRVSLAEHENSEREALIKRYEIFFCGETADTLENILDEKKFNKFVGVIMENINSNDLQQAEKALVQYLGCLNSYDFFRVLKFLTSKIKGEHEDKLSARKKIILIVALIEVDQLFITEEYSNKYGHHFRHGIAHFMYKKTDRTKINSDFKKIFDKAFKMYIKSKYVNICELSQITKYRKAIDLSSEQISSILSAVANLKENKDNDKKNLIKSLFSAIREIENENEVLKIKTQSEMISLDEKKEISGDKNRIEDEEKKVSLRKKISGVKKAKYSEDNDQEKPEKFKGTGKKRKRNQDNKGDDEL